MASINDVPRDVFNIIMRNLVIPRNDPEIREIIDKRARCYSKKKIYRGIPVESAQHLWIRRIIMTCRKFRKWGTEFRANGRDIETEIQKTKQLTRHNKILRRNKFKKKRDAEIPWKLAYRDMIADVREQFEQQSCYELYITGKMKWRREYLIAKLPRLQKYHGATVKELLLRKEPKNAYKRSWDYLKKAFAQPIDNKVTFKVTFKISDTEAAFVIQRFNYN